eukprot:gene10147-biopygen7415
MVVGGVLFAKALRQEPLTSEQRCTFAGTTRANCTYDCNCRDCNCAEASAGAGWYCDTCCDSCGGCTWRYDHVTTPKCTGRSLTYTDSHCGEVCPVQ